MSPGGIVTYGGMTPNIHPDAFIAPGAHVIGKVEIGAKASVWYNCVVRGDEEPIHIGAGSNVQDGSIIHTSGGIADTWIGENVMIGHMCLLHGCRIGDRAFVGMGSIVLDGAVIEGKSMLAAGAMLTPGKRIPSGQLWAGRPAKFMRDLRPEELVEHAEMVEIYFALSHGHGEALK
ncbi:MAG: gamma carbonic anhydrase family protein [Alphaproteobacteria bacterium]|jgi:carbonic anhydrase/acetyltransferase-like protein (isoleucine patch superfamily)